MINLKLSSLLTSIAEICKYRSDEINMVINLSKAARTIRDYQDDISIAFHNGKIKSMPGIDDFAYGLIKEYFESGKITLFEQIKEKYSEELIKIIRLSGIGAKKVFDIYSKFNIKSYDELKDFFRSNKDTKKISRIFDIEHVFIERIKFSMDYFESIKGKYPRWSLNKSLGKIIERLSLYSELEKIRVVGSVRRRKAYVGDMDILILPHFNKEGFNLQNTYMLIEKIKKEWFIKKKLSEQIMKDNASFRFSTIFDADLEIIVSTHKNFARDLIITTGSKKHIEKLKALALRKEMANKESGDINLITDQSYLQIILKTNKLIEEDDNYICEEEKDFYSKLGLSYIHPELREGNDEIELANGKYLPDLIKLEDIDGDLHIHSQWSDGVMDLKHIIKSAKKLDYEFISFSDHSASNKFGNGLSVEKLDMKREYIKKINNKNRKLRFLMGAEIDIDEKGNLDYPPEVINSLDIALASMHTGFKYDQEINTSRFLKAMQDKNIDIIAHPTGIVFGSRAPYFMDVDKVIENAAATGKALEINSYYLRLDLDELNAAKGKRAGAFFAINTDSHRENNLFMIRLGVDIARKAGIEKNDVINTFGLDGIRKWKKKR